MTATHMLSSVYVHDSEQTERLYQCGCYYWLTARKKACRGVSSVPHQPSIRLGTSAVRGRTCGVSGCSHEAICPSERMNQSVCSVLSEVRATIRVAGNPGKSARVQIVARAGSARHVGSVGMVQSACDAEHCVRSRVTGTRSGRAPVTGRPIAVIA